LNCDRNPHHRAGWSIGDPFFIRVGQPSVVREKAVQPSHRAGLRGIMSHSRDKQRLGIGVEASDVRAMRRLVPGQLVGPPPIQPL
jgi:hypothetical protein